MRQTVPDHIHRYDEDGDCVICGDVAIVLILGADPDDHPPLAPVLPLRGKPL